MISYIWTVEHQTLHRKKWAGIPTSLRLANLVTKIWSRLPYEGMTITEQIEALTPVKTPTGFDLFWKGTLFASVNTDSFTITFHTPSA